MQEIVLGLEVTEKEELHMRKAVVFSMSTIFSWKKEGDNKERDP